MEAIKAAKPKREAPVLQARLFGPFTLSAPDGGNIAISNRRAQALLALLCLTPNEALERDYVSKLLWPGRFQAQARASLRQCLLDLDKTLLPLAGKLLNASHSRIAINPGRLDSDLARLERSLAEADFEAACNLLETMGSRLLFDQMDFGAPFQHWLTAQRENVEHRMQLAVDRALAALEHRGNHAGRDLLSNAWKARIRAPTTPHDIKLRIAILPFAQYDAVGGAFFMADAVVEEMAFRLGEISALALVGRTSVFNVAQNGGTLPEIADELEASHLIEGEVHRFGDTIRVCLRLIDGKSGIKIWSDRYDGTVADAIGSRAIIGNHFILGLCGALEVDVLPPPARRMTTNRDAYALYLQGRALFMKMTADGVIVKAIERLEQALAIDPDFAECWAALAEAHLYSATFTPIPDRLERGEKMAECARRAIALDPHQGYARVTLAIYEFTRHNALAALDLAYEAYRLAPNDSEVGIRLGGFLLFLGRPRAALPYIQAAIEQDPVHGRNYVTLCAAWLCLGEIDRAIEAARCLADLGFPAGPLAIAYAANGEHAAAVETYYSMRTLLGTWIMPPPGMPKLDDAARDAYFMFAAKGVCGGDPEARAAYCRMLDALHLTMPDPYDISIAYPALYMGHAELVMAIYGKQPNLSNLFGLMFLWSDVPIIRQTVEHPDFLAFAEGMGFVAAWNKYGWPDRLPKDPRSN